MRFAVGTKKGTVTYKILNGIKGEMGRAELSLVIGVDRKKLSHPLARLVEEGELIQRKWKKKAYYRLKGTEAEDQTKKPFLCEGCLKREPEVKQFRNRAICGRCITARADNPSFFQAWDEKMSNEHLRKPIRR